MKPIYSIFELEKAKLLNMKNKTNKDSKKELNNSQNNTPDLSLNIKQMNVQ